MISIVETPEILSLKEKSDKEVEFLLKSVGRKYFHSSKPCSKRSIIDEYINLFLTEMFSFIPCHVVTDNPKATEKYVKIIKIYDEFSIGDEKIGFCSQYFTSKIHPSCDIILVTYRHNQETIRCDILASYLQGNGKTEFRELSYNSMYRLLLNLEEELMQFTLSKGLKDYITQLF